MSTASFEYDEENNGGTKNWDMGTSANSRAFGGESWSYEYIAHQNQNVHLLQKIKPFSNRPRIPATLPERLAFFRVYSTSYGKALVNLDFFDFNRLIWDYFFYVVFKLIPTSYIYYFLGSYVPEEHLYISKMVPIFAGYNILLVIAAITLLTFQGYYVMIMFYYAFSGLIYRSPWKSCNNDFIEEFFGNVSCIDIPSLQKLRNGSVRLQRTIAVYIATSKGNVTTSYVPAPYVYYTVISAKLFSEYKFTCVALFIVAGIFYKQLYKKYIWKVLCIFQNVLQIIYLASAAHLLLISLESQFARDEEDDETHHDMHQKIQDSSMFQEMVHAPPLIHFITSRTTDQVNPASDTALLVLSNTIFFFLKLLTHQKIIRYCEYVCGFCLRQFSDKHTFMFFFWPLYLSLVPFGDILVIVLYVVNFMTEFLTFVISYQTFVEVLLSKYESVRKWIALAIVIIMMIIIPPMVLSIGTNTSRTAMNKRTMVTFATVLWSSAFIEVAVIIFFYPITRLLDDIVFHYGSAPSQLTELFIKSIPVTYFLLFYLYFNNITEFCGDDDECLNNVFKNLNIGLITVAVALVTGVFYMTIKLVCFNGEEWGTLIRPVPDWGPLDHIQRQLRKYYDSREYIRSRDSRYLSRYLMTRASERSYQLDLVYERQGARSTLLQDALKIHSEKAKEKTE